MIPKISNVFVAIILGLFLFSCASSKNVDAGKKIDPADKERIENDKQKFEQKAND
jgi:hypothetical protein